jgi:hypothetical protein
MAAPSRDTNPPVVWLRLLLHTTDLAVMFLTVKYLLEWCVNCQLCNLKYVYDACHEKLY